MKNYGVVILAILICFLSLTGWSQVNQIVVSEHFTNTRCSNCASRNPGYFSNLARQNNVIHISYHPSRPYSSCVLNQHNVTGNDDRTRFYGIYGATPRLVINGQVVSASTNYSDTGIFTTHLRSQTDWEVVSTGVIQDNQLVVTTTVNRASSGSVESISVITQAVEDTVFYQAPNGEKEHFNVFRLNAQNRILEFKTEETALTIHDTVDVIEGWDFSRIKLISMLQREDKTMVQAAESEPVEVNDQTALVRTKPAGPLTVFPNPAHRTLTVQWNQSPSPEVRIYNLHGALVLSQFGKEVNLESLDKGIYMLYASDEKDYQSARIVVK